MLIGWVVNARPRPLYLREINPELIVQEAGWTPGPVWTGRKNLVPTRLDARTVRSVAIRFTD